MVGNLLVTLFFLTGAVIFAVIGFRFNQSSNKSFKHFGFGLFSFAASFLIWAGIVATQPGALELWMSIGVLPFVAGFIFLVSAATFDWNAQNRNLIFGFAAAFLVVLFVLRTWILPSAPSFSDAGLIYFNAQPLVLLLYVLVFAGGFMPAVHVVTRQIGDRLLAALTRIFFNIVVLSGVILMVASDENLQYLNGFVMLAGFYGLLVIYLPKSASAKLNA